MWERPQRLKTVRKVVDLFSTGQRFEYTECQRKRALRRGPTGSTTMLWTPVMGFARLEEKRLLMFAVWRKTSRLRFPLGGFSESMILFIRMFVTGLR